MSLGRSLPHIQHRQSRWLWALIIYLNCIGLSLSASAAQRSPLASEWASADLMRQRCTQAVNLMMNGPRFKADHGTDAGRYLGIWMAPFFDLLAQTEQLQHSHPDAHWRETAGYCQLSINLALTQWHTGNSSDWLAPFLQTENSNAASSWQQHQWRKAYPSQWQADYPIATKEEINAARLGFKLALKQTLPITLPANCLEKTALRSSDLSNAPNMPPITVDVSDPNRYLRFMRSAYRSECRAFVYRAYQRRGGKEARKQLNRLFAARLSLATDMGFSSWAHYRQKEALLDRKQVRDFLLTLERELSTRVPAETKENFKPWDHWRLKEKTVIEPRVKKVVPSKLLYEKQLRSWAATLEITVKKVNLPTWGSNMAVWQLTDGQGLAFGEIYLDLSSTHTVLGTSRLRYPVAGFQSGAMLISANKAQPVTPSKIDSSVLKAIYGILFHPTYADFSAYPYADLEGFEERLFHQITKTNSVTPIPPIKLLKRVLTAKLAYAYHQHNLSMTDLETLNTRLLAKNLYLVDTPLVSLPYGMSTLGSPDSLSYRGLWQYALARRIATRYHHGEITISDIMLALYQLRGSTARQSLINLAGLNAVSAPLSSALANTLLRH